MNVILESHDPALRIAAIDSGIANQSFNLCLIRDHFLHTCAGEARVEGANAGTADKTLVCSAKPRALQN